jgi:hypothetical protein
MLAKAKAKVKHIYSTGVIYDYHLWLSKYFYNTGHFVSFGVVYLHYQKTSHFDRLKRLEILQVILDPNAGKQLS